jgi:hypothetical protein
MVMGAYLVTRGNSRETKSRWLKLYWFLCNNCVCFAFVISCIYWSMLYRDEHNSLNNYLVHATNSLVLIVDLLIVAYPHRMSHCVYPMTCGAVYMLFTIVYTFLGGLDKDGGNYVYPILDWKNKPQMSTIVGVGCVLCLGVVHVIFGFVHRTRNGIHRCLTSEKSEKNQDQSLPFVKKNSGNKL